LKFQRSERAATETNRAAAVALNADVRRTKARLTEEVVRLRKLAAKKVTVTDQSFSSLVFSIAHLSQNLTSI
jgi:hypothetical protein